MHHGICLEGKIMTNWPPDSIKLKAQQWEMHHGTCLEGKTMTNWQQDSILPLLEGGCLTATMLEGVSCYSVVSQLVI